jgi:hypothetical protein
MEVQKYDIRRPDAEGGGFEERYWSPINCPVFRDGKLVNIIHRVEDVTDYVRLDAQRRVHDDVSDCRLWFVTITVHHPCMHRLNRLLLLFTLATVSLSVDAGRPVSTKQRRTVGAVRKATPCVIARAKPRNLECAAAVTSALTAYDPAFQPYGEGDYLPSIIDYFSWSSTLAPFAAVADFNGDGALDVVIDGHSRKRSRLIAVLSSKSRYTVVEIERSDRFYDPRNDRYDEEHGKWKFISRIVPAGRQTPLVDDPPFNMKLPGFELEYWQKAASVFSWTGNSWNEYVSGD